MHTQVLGRFMKALKFKQNGSIIPTIAFSMVAMMGMAGMVFDASNVFSSKTRLQNIIDATTMTAANVLDETFSQAQARNAARKIFDENIDQPGNGTLKDIGLTSTDLVIQFSDTRNPFIASPAATRFARVRINPGTASVDTIFMKILGIEALELAGSAVAGPSPALGTVCNLTPTIICGDSFIPPDANGMFGYNYGDQVTLALGDNKNNDVGPGNYQLLSVDESAKGGNAVRDYMAGGYTGCATSTQTIETKPGKTKGPVTQGINTRFGIFSGPVSEDDYPPDLVTDAGANGYPDTYAEYTLDNSTKSYDEPSDGIASRRVVNVAFGNCTGTVNGRGDVPIIGFGCVFLNQPMAKDDALFGELVRECKSGGIPGPAPIDGPGIHTIQLYGDPDRWDS